MKPRINEQRVVLVTGASSGIGLSSANALFRAGYSVIAGVRGDKPSADLEQGIQQISLDLCSQVDIENCAAEISRMPEGLYGLVNNAGFCASSPLELMSEAELNEMLAVNVVAVHSLTRHLLEPLRRGSGRVVNLSSTAGTLASALNGGYSISKAALDMLSESMRLEYGRFGIQIVVICPGVVATPFWGKLAKHEEALMANEHHSAYASLYRQRNSMLGQFGSLATEPAAVAATVVSALRCTRPKLRYVVGADANRRLLLRYILPRRLLARLGARMLPHVEQ